MSEVKYIFGPVPSRRLGSSLGISPIPEKTCNYSCVFCQLGRTNKMTNERKEFFPLADILKEFDLHQKKNENYDVITIVGEGEPTLYLKLGELIKELKKRTEKPVVVITNGALLYDKGVREELCNADIVMPSLDSVDEEMFKKVDRPMGSLDYQKVTDGLIEFSKEYKGQLYLEIMLMKGINDDDESLYKFKNIIKNINYDRVYINTPVRPPAESDVSACDRDKIENAVKILNGISIDILASGSFSSDVKDDYDAVKSIIGRHPMNQFEIKGFLESRKNNDIEGIFTKLKNDSEVEAAHYKGYFTYRIKKG